MVYPLPPKNKSFFFNLSYTGKLTDKVSKYLRKRDLNIAFKTNNSLGKHIKNNKSKVNKLYKSGVYKLKCGTCPKVYVGQTGRTFKQRIYEHKRSFLKNKKDSNYAIHLINEKHIFDENFDILHVQKQKTQAKSP